MSLGIKMSFKAGVMACAIGFAVIGLGSLYPHHISVRLAGLIIVCGGFVAVGKHAYTRIQEKAKERRSIRNATNKEKAKEYGKRAKG